MKKYFANILTSIRVVISFIMLGFTAFSNTFLKLFCICGITDLVDGPIARATGSESVLGAKLDTAGDILTYAAMIKVMILEKAFTLKTVLWFGLPLSGLVISAVIAKIRFGSFFFIHTVLGKVLGVGCFFVPFSFASGTIHTHLTFLWVIALLAAVEMIAIQLCNDRRDSDVSFFFCVKRKAERVQYTEK